MAHLTNAQGHKIELCDSMTNRIGSGPNSEVKMKSSSGLLERHAGIRYMNNGWLLLNLSFDARSVRHRGHPISDCIEMAHGDMISIMAERFVFYVK